MDTWHAVIAHQGRLLALATARCTSREDAEDVVQEAMLRCATFTKLDLSRLEPFLTSVTLRLCVDLHRDRTRGERALQRVTESRNDAEDPGEVVCRRTDVRQLEAALAGLPTSQRRVMVDRVRGLTVPQIARRHGLTYKAVESALSRARTTLRAGRRRGRFTTSGTTPRRGR